eukprot:Skav205424  [mRNA]  locus=scaffold582:342273:356124:- [translate_table: standard]
MAIFFDDGGVGHNGQTGWWIAEEESFGENCLLWCPGQRCLFPWSFAGDWLAVARLHELVRGCLKGAELMINEFNAKMNQSGAPSEPIVRHSQPPSPPPSLAASPTAEESPYVESTFPPPRGEVEFEPAEPLLPMEEASEDLLLEVRRAKENFMESFKAHLNSRCTPEEEAQNEADAWHDQLMGGAVAPPRGGRRAAQQRAGAAVAVAIEKELQLQRQHHEAAMDNILLQVQELQRELRESLDARQATEMETWQAALVAMAVVWIRWQGEVVRSRYGPVEPRGVHGSVTGGHPPGGSELLNTTAAEEEITLLREELAKLRNEPRRMNVGQVAGWGPGDAGGGVAMEGEPWSVKPVNSMMKVGQLGGVEEAALESSAQAEQPLGFCWQMHALTADYQQALADISSLRASYDAEIDGLQEELLQCKAKHLEEHPTAPAVDFLLDQINPPTSSIQLPPVLACGEELASLEEQLQSAKEQNEAAGAKKSQSLQDVLSKRVVQLEAKLAQLGSEKDALNEAALGPLGDGAREAAPPGGRHGAGGAACHRGGGATVGANASPFGFVRWNFGSTQSSTMLKCLQVLRLGAATTCSRPWGSIIAVQWRCFVSSELAKWQRRSQRLESLLRRVRCPQLENFEVDGITYQLPVSAGPPTVEPSREELEYLGGFFDGDGCVTMVRSSGKIFLSVSQAVQRPNILLRFREAFGGGIYREHPATGFSQATLQWHVAGKNARLAALALCGTTLMKHAQLWHLLDGNIEATHRKRVAQTLQHLKLHTHKPSQSGFKCTWAYLVGFFDAEGSISVGALYTSFSLNVRQKNPYVLKVLLAFLETEHSIKRWKLYSLSDGTSKLECGDFSAAKISLKHFLVHGLSLKRPQAEESMKLTQENHHVIRDRVSEMNGQQKWLERLDEAGITRAKAIKKLRSKQHYLRKRSDEQEHQESLEAIDAEISQLQEEHALGKLRSRCSRLRVQLRKLLSEGNEVLATTAENFQAAEARQLQAEEHPGGSSQGAMAGGDGAAAEAKVSDLGSSAGQEATYVIDQEEVDFSTEIGELGSIQTQASVMRIASNELQYLDG